MNDRIKSIIEKLLLCFPLKDIIIFESLPDFSDNAREVFDEMIRQGINKKYKLVWATHGNTPLPKELEALENVTAVSMDSAKYKYYYSYFARAILPENYFLQRRREGQYYMYLAHGAAFKGIKDRRYTVPKDCTGCDFAVFSDYLGYYDIRNLNADESTVNMVDCGYARNDLLFNCDVDLKTLFPDREFERLIYWLPTFRQKTSDNTDTTKQYSSISVPFIYNKENAVLINDCAKRNNTLLVLKPHPAQDMSTIKEYDLSNIVLIDNDFLEKHGVKNYELLGASDALLSDYSSAFYDYLLCDKPIGFCWEDFEEYTENEGFITPYKELTSGCEKLYSADELCAFIERVNNGVDTLKEYRNTVKEKVFTYPDGNATKRIVEHILKEIRAYWGTLSK